MDNIEDIKLCNICNKKEWEFKCACCLKKYVVFVQMYG